MSSREKPNSAADVVAPFEIIELSHLKTRSGDPFAVRCGRLDEVDFLKLLGLPGARMTVAELESSLKELDVADLTKLRALLPGIIEAGTSIEGPAGEWVAPGFSWDPAKCPPAVPGQYLSTLDASTIGNTIMRLSGFDREAAEAASFPVREDAQREGAGTLEIQPGDEPDAIAGA